MKKVLGVFVLVLASTGVGVAILDPCYDPEAKIWDCQCIENRCYSICGGNVGAFSCQRRPKI